MHGDASLRVGAVVDTLCEGGGEVPVPVHLHLLAHPHLLVGPEHSLLSLHVQGGGAAGGGTLCAAGSHGPVQGGEELAQSLVLAPGEWLVTGGNIRGSP